MSSHERLPLGVVVFERGWLSANNILFAGVQSTALVDTGYCTHASQTVALIRSELGERPLDLIVNTHLHSDHCGGNAALQSAFAGVETLIPPGQAAAVAHWDPVALTYEPTGQECPRFSMDGVLSPGSEILLGDLAWQVHAAPGHDPHSIILFEPQSRTLISADALWEAGFGVVFPELEGEEGFDDVAATFDLIEYLAPAVIIPGHGPVFYDAARALAIARRRLDGFKSDPRKHALHAAKVLVKFKLLDLQEMQLSDLERWAERTPYFGLVFARYFAGLQFSTWLQTLGLGLEKSGAARIEDGRIFNV